MTKKKLALIPIASAAAETLTHPIDVIKTQKQVNSHPFPRIIQSIYTKNGIRGFYPSLPPAILRHWVYTLARISIYEHYRSSDDSFFKKLTTGIAAGGIAQALASPTDLVKVKLQMGQYKTMTECIKATYKNEGVKGFYRGISPNVMRACTVNMGELVAYDTGKHWLLEHGLQDNIGTHTLSSIFSGFWATLCSTPADVIKSRMMSGTFTSIPNIIKTEGIGTFWHGFFPNWGRLAPWQLTFWLTYEQLRKLSGMEGFK